ncbi:MAG: SDR family oxidoreductase [Oleiphilaceae bacterium]|nr:SDR family oxidoreductase [Oleiphilaceae bacterium]
MSQQTVLITGANRGIGLSFCKHFAQQGALVYAACRQTSDELAALGVHVIEGVDIGGPEGAARVKEALQGVSLDLLVNNAGILRNEILGQIDYKSIAQQFHVNALGPLRITEALLNNLHAGSKVALITSRMGSIADNTSGGRYGYRMSKCALNIAGVSLAHDLKDRNIAVGIFHPGLVGTEMIGGHGDITPDEAAERLIQRIAALDLGNTGTFWHSNGEILPW